jgi:putative ABC transport system permease protein
MIRSNREFAQIASGIVFVAVVIGLVSVLLMAVSERIREIGILRAIGMRKGTVVRLIVLEALALALAGGIAGTAAGWGVASAAARSGIDLRRMGASVRVMGSEAIVRPVTSVSTAAWVVALVVAVGAIAALYPAWRATRIRPIEAIGRN